MRNDPNIANQRLLVCRLLFGADIRIMCLRMDNGPEFIADTLRDWCKEQNIQANYCDPGSPWQNGRIESFNSRLRDELLTREVFDSMWEIRFMLEEHRNNYNHYRPHSALAYLTPIEYATKWRTKNSVLAS